MPKQSCKFLSKYLTGKCSFDSWLRTQSRDSVPSHVTLHPVTWQECTQWNDPRSSHCILTHIKQHSITIIRNNKRIVLLTESGTLKQWVTEYNVVPLRNQLSEPTSVRRITLQNSFLNTCQPYLSVYSQIWVSNFDTLILVVVRIQFPLTESQRIIWKTTSRTNCSAS